MFPRPQPEETVIYEAILANPDLYRLLGKLPMWLVLILYYNFSGFSAKSYHEKIFSYSFFGLRVLLPNPPDRRTALRKHDLHHVLSGIMDVSWLYGEAVIGNYELGAGCGKSVPAWFFSLANAFLGFPFHPRRSFREFVRGRRAGTLFRRDEAELTALMSCSVEDVRSVLNIYEPSRHLRPTFADYVWFVVCMLAGVPAAILLIGLSVFGALVVNPLIRFSLWLKKKRWEFTEYQPALDSFPKELQYQVQTIRDIIKHGTFKTVPELALRRLLENLQTNHDDIERASRGFDEVLFPTTSN